LVSGVLAERRTIVAPSLPGRPRASCWKERLTTEHSAIGCS